MTFVFNGGLGAASAYLDIGAIGQRRLPLDHVVISESPKLVPNLDTWLDFTDLVFIDPPGTGYSRIAGGGEDARRNFWSVDGDADALAVFTSASGSSRRGVSNRLGFIAGESYGWFLAPKIAHEFAASRASAYRGG